MICRQIILFITSVLIATGIRAQADSTLQDKTIETLLTVPLKYISAVSDKADQLEQKLDKKSEKAFMQLQKQEEKIKRKLTKIDSVKAIALFGKAEQQYKDFKDKLNNKVSSLKKYIPSLDTLSSSLRFLNQNPQLLSKAKEAGKKLKDAVAKAKGLEGKFQKAEDIKKFLKERKQYLKDQLSKFGFAKELKKLNKQVYYYNQQLNEYTSLLKDHKKAEKKAIELLSNTKLFKDFMRKNSMLASLFRMPGDPNDPALQTNLAGLQTRAQVINLIQQQITVGGPNAQQQFQQNMQAAQSQLNELKNKILNAGGGSSDAEMPDFKPNNQKTKSFLQRLEYGANIQSQKATYFFPVTSDIGLSVGYKLNDKSVIGFGGSYKMGWGRGWNNINISHQGVGLRTYADIKLKGSFWVSGGYEQNYKSAFNDFDQLRDRKAWQQSGLVGISKVISLKTKLFTKTSLKLLWDFLSYQQVPRTQPLLFRVGYSLK